VIAPENPLPVAGGETRTTSLFVLLPRGAFRGGERHVQVVVSDGAMFTTAIPYRLLGPATGGAGGGTP
jgi:hypothetical protein